MPLARLAAKGTNWTIVGYQTPTSTAYDLTKHVLMESNVSVDEGFSSPERLFNYVISSVHLILDNTRGIFNSTGDFPISGSEIIHISLFGRLRMIGYVEPAAIKRIPVTHAVQKLDITVVSAFNYFRKWKIGRACASDRETFQALFSRTNDYPKFWARYKKTASEVSIRDGDGEPLEWRDVTVYMNPRMYFGISPYDEPRLLEKAEYSLVYPFDTDQLDFAEEGPYWNVDPPLTRDAYAAWDEQDENGDLKKQWTASEIVKRIPTVRNRRLTFEEIIRRAIFEYNHYVPEGTPEDQGGLKNFPTIQLGDISLSDIVLNSWIPLLDDLHHVEIFHKNSEIYIAVFPVADYTGGHYGTYWPTGYFTLYRLDNKTDLAEVVTWAPPWGDIENADDYIGNPTDDWYVGRIGYQVLGLPDTSFAIYSIKRLKTSIADLYTAYAKIYEYNASTGVGNIYDIQSESFYDRDNTGYLPYASVVYIGGEYLFASGEPTHIFEGQHEDDIYKFVPSTQTVSYWGNIFFSKVALSLENKSFADLFILLGKLSSSVPYVYTTPSGATVLCMRDREYEKDYLSIPAAAIISWSQETKRYSLLEEPPEFSLDEVTISTEHANAIRDYYVDTFFKWEVQITKLQVDYKRLEASADADKIVPFTRINLGKGTTRGPGTLTGDLGIIQRVKLHELFCDITLRKKIASPLPRKP